MSRFILELLCFRGTFLMFYYWSSGQKPLFLAFVMTRVGKPFPLKVTWDCSSGCKHSWLPLELYWDFSESEGGPVTIELYLSPEWVIRETLESNPSDGLSSLLWQAASMSFAPVLHGSKTMSHVELFYSLRWLTHCRLLHKILVTHPLLNSPPFFFFLHKVWIHKMGHLYTAGPIFVTSNMDVLLLWTYTETEPHTAHMQMWSQRY